MSKKYPQIPVKSDKTKVASTVKPIKPIASTLYDKININSKVGVKTKTLNTITKQILKRKK